MSPSTAFRIPESEKRTAQRLTTVLDAKVSASNGSGEENQAIRNQLICLIQETALKRVSFLTSVKQTFGSNLRPREIWGESPVPPPGLTNVERRWPGLTQKHTATGRKLLK